MNTHVENFEHRVSIIHNEIAQWREAWRTQNMAGDPPTAAFYTLLNKLYAEDYPLAGLLDSSDLLFHAEGPGAAHNLPWLSSLNWLTSTAENNLRKLSAAAFDVMGTDGKTLAKSLDFRLSGIAPGSIWLGIKLMPPAADLLPEDGTFVTTLTPYFGKLPELARFIDDEGLRPGIAEFSPDPAMRDVQLAALYRFSPTGNRGIHTLEISSPASGRASLSQRERVVLKQVLDKPDTRQAQAGSFIGQVREADLDKTRLHLRGVTGIGTLRCVVPHLTAEQARALLGHTVRAEGHYQTDREGRPRLLFIERITAVGTDNLL